MRINESCGMIFGEAGSGKTFNSVRMAIDYLNLIGKPNPRILIINFDNLPIDRASQCVKTHFSESVKNITILNVLQAGSATKSGKASKKDIYADLEFDEDIDFVTTYEYVRDTLYPALKKEITGYDFVIVDAMFPTVRNSIGLAWWLHKNPDRAGAKYEDWSAITPIEARYFNMFVMLAQKQKIPIILTGTLVDNYEDNVKKGRVFGCKDSTWKGASYALEVVKAVPKRRTAGAEVVNNIDIVCYKSDANTWKDTVTPGSRELLDIMLESGSLEL